MLMWGLTTDGAISVNVINTYGTIISATAPWTLSLNTWTHITQTFSATNGSRLYINGILVTTVSAATGQPIGPYAIIGASPNNTNSCGTGSISKGQFYGMIDEYRVFGIELTPVDICRLAHP